VLGLPVVIQQRAPSSY